MTISWLGREIRTNMQSDSVIHSSLVEQRLNQRQENLALSLINASDSLSVFCIIPKTLFLPLRPVLCLYRYFLYPWWYANFVANQGNVLVDAYFLNRDRIVHC